MVVFDNNFIFLWFNWLDNNEVMSNGFICFKYLNMLNEGMFFFILVVIKLLEFF